MFILGRANSVQYRLTRDKRSGQIIFVTPRNFAIRPIIVLIPLCDISIARDKKFISLVVKDTSGGIK